MPWSPHMGPGAVMGEARVDKNVTRITLGASRGRRHRGNWGGAYERVIQQERCVAVSRAVLRLEPPLMPVVVMHFGLDGEGERTLDEIGKMLGVTKEAVRQREQKAFRFLRRELRCWAPQNGAVAA